MRGDHVPGILATCLAAIALCCVGQEALAAEATRSEIGLAKDWINRHLTSDTPASPFSFVYAGRTSSELLGGWKREQSSNKAGRGRTRHTLTYTDPATGLTITCEAIVYTGFPAVEWVLELANTSKSDTPIIEDLQPLDIDLKGSSQGFVLHRALGDDNSANSFRPIDEPMGPGDRGVLAYAPIGGRSSQGNMPFFNLDWHDGGVVIAIGWTGQWKASFQQTSDGVARVHAGQELTHFVLHPGETVRTPSILLVFWSGTDDLRGNNLLRQLLIDQYVPRRKGKVVCPPICASVNWTEPDGTYEKPHIEVMPALAKRGIEVFWSDMDPQQWYPIDFPQGTGTWEPDPAKYPNGLKPIGEAAHNAGIEYLLWFEPERAEPNTYVSKTHPEWMMSTGEGGVLFNLGDPVARKWLTDYIDVQIEATKLDWLRWDFNIWSPLDYWRHTDAPDRQGISEMRYVEGLYAMWDDLRARHPGLIVDNCAGGGRRIDTETLKRGIPLWHSDLQCFGTNPTAEQLQNAGLFRWVPFHACGAFGYEPSYEFRSAMTMGNILAVGHQDRLTTAAPETEADVIRTVKAYKKARPFMMGDFYPLFAHTDVEDAWFGYQFHRPDLNSGMTIVFRRKSSPDSSNSLELKGIKPDASYQVTFADSPESKTVSGGELARYSLRIDSAPGSAVIYYEKVSK